MTHPSLSLSLRMSFTIAWNVAGELHNPKNITVGLNSPILVLKAAFHWSLSLIQTLLYPHCMSNLVKYLAPEALILSIMSEIRGRGCAF